MSSASSLLIAPLSHYSLFLRLSHVSDWKTPGRGFPPWTCDACSVCVYGPRISAAPALSPLIARRLGRRGNELYSVAPLFPLMTLWKVALKDTRRRGISFLFQCKRFETLYWNASWRSVCWPIGNIRNSVSHSRTNVLVMRLHIWSGSRRTPCWAGISETSLQGMKAQRENGVVESKRHPFCPVNLITFCLFIYLFIGDPRPLR